MNRNIRFEQKGDNVLHSKNSKVVVAVICIAVVLLCIVTFCVHIINRKQEQEQYPNIPDVSVSGDLGYFSADSNEVLVRATTGFVFTANTVEQSIDIMNPIQNKYNFVVSVYLGDGVLLYESNYLSPGESVSQIQISQPLDAGVYKNSVMAYRFYSADNTQIVSQCEFPIEIKCVN